ncbi:MAG TPA: PEP/pyruvate-binding domain-containing protein [Bryobacteraceae bacterium]|nr:PEP/pyruvate-binding domain-containing protein [Bryobacteraceae bacterium]
MRMAAAGLPTPPAFVLPVNWSRRLSEGKETDSALADTLADGISRLEKLTGLEFGSSQRPLLVSVRSGSAVSMPGMLETVLDIGLNQDSVEGLIRSTGNPRLAWDSYRRLIQGYGEVVRGLPAGAFDALAAQAVSNADVESDRELDFRALRQLARDFLSLYRELAGEPFPLDPRKQLCSAAAAVFRSWDAPKAVVYRRLNGINNNIGTAVTVQKMVFGNAGGNSGSGVGFTRNPANGERHLYLDFRFNGQGEDVVAGRQRTQDHDYLRRTVPAVWRQIETSCQTLETLFRDAQDFEFTLESGTLYFLQSRDEKRTDWAAVRIAVDLVEEGLIDIDEASRHLSGIDLTSVSRTRFETHSAKPLAHAQPASIGVVSGALAFDASSAERMAREGIAVILARHEIATADISGIASAAGILTATGSRSSHAAVVARQLGKVCLVGCTSLKIDPDHKCCNIGKKTFHEGDELSLDGNDGAVYCGRINVLLERPERELKAIAEWEIQKMHV